MALEREYNIPLRKEWLKVPRYKRAKKAAKALKEFLSRHMKAPIKDVKIGKWLNIFVWEHGIKKPPHHIKVKAVKDDKGIVRAELSILPQEAIAEKKAKEEKEKAEKGKVKEKKEEKEEKEEKKTEEEKKEEEDKKEKEKILHKQIPKAQAKTAIKPKATPIKRMALEK